MLNEKKVKKMIQIPVMGPWGPMASLDFILYVGLFIPQNSFKKQASGIVPTKKKRISRLLSEV